MEEFQESDGIRYVKYNLPALQQFISDPAFLSLPNLPISRHRAESYLANPRGEESDFVMYLAFADDELAGYRLMLPDEVIANHERLKMAWYSCVWIHPGYRGKGIAKNLVKEAKKDWNDLILLQDPVPASKGLYTWSGDLDHSVNLKGIRCYMRFSMSGQLLNRFPKLKPIQHPLRWLDYLANLPVRLLAWLRSSKTNLDGSFEFLNRFDQSSERLIQSLHIPSLTKRGTAELNWMLQQPWVIQTPVTVPLYQRYFFSATARQYRFIPVHLYGSDDQLCAVVLYSLRNGHLVLQYGFYQEETVNIVWPMTRKLIRSTNAHTFSTFCPMLTKFMRENRTGALYKKEISRLYGISKPLAKWLQERNVPIRFHGGDGDAGLV